MLQHICSQLDWAHLNPEGAGSSQCSKCWMEVFAVPPWCALGGWSPRTLHVFEVFVTSIPTHGCARVPSVWVWAMAVSLQGHPFYPEAGEGTVKMKGGQKGLGSVSSSCGSCGNCGYAAAKPALLSGRHGALLAPTRTGHTCIVGMSFLGR